MNDRPPVYDPGAPRRKMNLIGKIVVGVFLACGLIYAGLMLLVMIAWASYGNNK